MRTTSLAKDLLRRSSMVRGSHNSTAARPVVRRRTHALAVLLIASALGPQAGAATLAGSIPGSFDVTPGGAATYTIPINLPRGSGGLTPSLSLTYNSQIGEGSAGFGWSLSGLSAITRCPKTIDADGVTQQVQLVAGDDYCWNGQRLRLASGTYGGSATYNTIAQNYALITSFGFSNVSGGPGYFTVQTKDGMTYEYGKPNNATVWAQGANSNVVLAWLLDKVTDPNGNY